ncbi:MAG TPA: hypothetical protein GX529_00555, partial [Firmicutes bacterium]|nr:hypothetical protein [Candidatus Fermentithermobacillaceae bacterium]
GTQFSKSTVSALCKKLDPLVCEWNERPLGEKCYPFVLMDAIVIEERKRGQVRSQSIMLSIGKPSQSGTSHAPVSPTSGPLPLEWYSLCTS